MRTKTIKSLIMTLLMAVLIIVGMAAISQTEAYADGEYDGSVFISLSDDGKFVVSDGEISDVPLAHLEVPLQDIAEINLADWDLEFYSYTDYDTGEPDPDAPTVLKLYLYMLRHYYGSAGDGVPLRASGAQHSFFMEHFWGHDCNLLYYVNGTYPLYEEGWGATADGIKLNDGDFVDIAMYTDWGFYMDANAGFNYFATSESEPEDGDITFDYQTVAGEPLTVQVIRGMGNVDVGADTSFSAADDLCIHYGEEINVDDDSDLFLEDGKAEITFDEPGTYYVWADGGIGESTGEPCSCAAVAKVTVGQSVVNRAPRIRAGVDSEVAKTTKPGKKYTVDLSGIFTDDDGDNLTYKVSVNGGDYAVCSAAYEYLAESEGAVTLDFKANDGKTDSTDVYKVTLTVSEDALVQAEGLKVVDKNCRVWPVYEIVDYETYDEYDQHGIYGYVHPAYRIIIPEAMDFDIVENPDMFIIGNPDDETGARNCTNVGQNFDWMFETGPVNRLSISKASYQNTGVGWSTFFNILGSDGEAYGYTYDENAKYTALEVWGAEKQRNLDEGMDAYFLFIDYDRNAKPTGETMHDITAHAEVPATCTEDGTKPYWSCSVCNKMFSDAACTHVISAPEVIPAKGHSWRNWEVATAPTLEEPGVMRRTCSRCEEEETKPIPKLTEAVVSVRVNSEAGKPAKLYKDLYVRSDYAYNGGLKLYDNMSTVTMADAIVAAHMEEYGESYKGSSAAGDINAQLIITNDYGFPWTIKIFNSTKSSTYWLNNDFAMSGMFDIPASDGDLVSVELYESEDYSDTYLYIDQEGDLVNDAEGYVNAKVVAMLPDENYEYHPTPVEGAKVVMKGNEDNSTYEAVTDENGMAKFMPDVIGTYTVSITQAPFENPWLPQAVEAKVTENAHTVALAKKAAIAEIEAYAEENADKADEAKLTLAVHKAERKVNAAEDQEGIDAAVADAKAKIDELVEAYALEQAKTAAIEDLKALIAENKDKVLDPDKLELTVLEAIEDVRDAETEADVEAIKAAAAEAVQALVDEKTAADEAAEQAAQALADAKTAAAAELDAVALSAYSEEDQSEMQDIIDAAKAEIAAAETVDEVESILASAKEDLGEYSTPAEKTEAAKAEVLAEIEEIDPDDYVDSERAAGVIRDAKTAIAAAEDPEDVQEIMSELYEVLDSLDTEASVEELIDDMIDEIDEEFNPEDYVDGDQEAAKALIDKAKEDIAKAKTSSEIYDILEKLYEDLGKLTTNEEESAATEDAKEEALEKLQDMLIKETGKDKILAKDKQTAEVAILKAIIRLQGAESAKDVDSIVKEAEAALKQLKDAKVKADKIAKQTAAAKKLKVKGLKAKSKKLKFKVSWKKTKGAGGYQVQYKLKSAKKFSTLKASVSKAKVTSKKLKKGKKYIFRVRTWKKVAGKKVYG